MLLFLNQITHLREMFQGQLKHIHVLLNLPRTFASIANMFQTKQKTILIKKVFYHQTFILYLILCVGGGVGE